MVRGVCRRAVAGEDAGNGPEDTTCAGACLLKGTLPSYINSFGISWVRFAFSAREKSLGQSDALLPPRQDVRRGGPCRRSYISSGFPQMAFIRRSSGVDMPWISAAAISRLETGRDSEVFVQRMWSM